GFVLESRLSPFSLPASPRPPARIPARATAGTAARRVATEQPGTAGAAPPAQRGRPALARCPAQDRAEHPAGAAVSRSGERAEIRLPAPGEAQEVLPAAAAAAAWVVARPEARLRAPPAARPEVR